MQDQYWYAVWVVKHGSTRRSSHQRYISFVDLLLWYRRAAINLRERILADTQLHAPVAAFSTDELNDAIRLYLASSQPVLHMVCHMVGINIHLVQQAECQITMDPGLELHLDVEVEVES